MKWLIDNWYKSTPFLAPYLLLILIIFVWRADYALFLIWLQSVVYFIHQAEEYVWPGGFVKFFNNKLLGSNQDASPLNKVASFWINIPIIFLGFPLSAVLASTVDMAFGIWTAYFSVINALSHVGMFFRFKFSYNPGLIASTVLNIPIGVYTIHYFFSRDLIDLNWHWFGLAIGISIQLMLMIYGFLILKPKVTDNTIYQKHEYTE